jgi:hypothetical protein
MGKRKQNRTSGRPQIIEHLKQASVRWAARVVVAGLALAAFCFGARKIWAAIAQRPDFTDPPRPQSSTPTSILAPADDAAAASHAAASAAARHRHRNPARLIAVSPINKVIGLRS